ncbi:MAG TPA: bifunctional oligoribonuclease/PAP phosphatase NrnA [Sphingobacteriaceae bacterium]|nr:bifunctional oligoribonuclease/PAP phosphatase NrnA [Sphingobacteriaceae bacterium]
MGFQNIKDKLKTPSTIVITTHFKPDGDALGSSLAMSHWLKQKGHEVQIIAPSDFPYFLDWLPGREEVIIYTEQKERSDQMIRDAAIIFCLDFNGLGRTQDMAPSLQAAEGTKIMIDHHLAPEGFDDERYWDSSAAATAELVYKFIVHEFDDAASISPALATCLYTGIMTDTGSFRFKSTTPEVHHIIADLIEKGAKNWEIHENIFNSNTETRLRFLGFCLAHRLVVDPEHRTAWMAISKQDLVDYSVGTGDTEGLVNYALSIQGIQFAALIIERQDIIKFSFRSIGDFPCNEFSSMHFNGGGHLNAAGGNAQGTLEEAVRKFKSLLPTYKNLLTQ